MAEFTPGEIVKELDKYIVGQADAKKAVAVALRNRYRRRLVNDELREEISPKNILMIGPTGVGKTEIARRLARLVGAPFVKVEATKFTEVGYVGRDVESMVRDLVEVSVRMVREEKQTEVQSEAEKLAEERLVEILVPDPAQNKKTNPLDNLFNRDLWSRQNEEPSTTKQQQQQELDDRRAIVREKIRRQELEDELVEVEVEDRSPNLLEVFNGSGMEEMGINIRDALGGIFPGKTRKKRVPLAQARKIYTQQEAEKLIDPEQVNILAIDKAEQEGIIFIDELDKIASKASGSGPDVSREGVQRDILPIVEGSTVLTKYGPVKTDYMLFIAAGAFHVARPADLIPELQGRFPIRVELDRLRQEDFVKILCEPRNSLLKQYTALVATEGTELEFTGDGVRRLAELAELVNQQTEDIGARRLATMLEKVLEDILFEAPAGEKIVIDASFVGAKLNEVTSNFEVAKYIL